MSAGPVMPVAGAATQDTTLHTVDIVRRKRDGHTLTPAEITHITRGAADGSIDDALLSAFLMATFLRGMEAGEVQALTRAMSASGMQLHMRQSGRTAGRTVDKHSSGGVGDKTTFLVTAIAAAGGLRVPKISGRALGHTGGTLDKLDSIPGFGSALSPDEMRRVLDRAGCVIVSQTADLVPADRRLYAIRDHIGAVESPYLLCSSIMSKKLATGLDALVLDVKTGSGASLTNPAAARFLARLMVETGEAAGIRTVALLSEMSQPLGRFAGNSVEVLESLALLRGERNPDSDDLRELSLILAGWMLYLGGMARSAGEGRDHAEKLLQDGSALKHFEQMIALQGGDLYAVKHAPAHQHLLRAPRSGYLFSMDCTAIGWAVQRLGAGRSRKGEPVSAHAGIEMHAKLGASVAEGDPLCTLFAEDPARLAEPLQLLSTAIRIADAPPRAIPLVHEALTRDTLGESLSARQE